MQGAFLVAGIAGMGGAVIAAGIALMLRSRPLAAQAA